MTLFLFLECVCVFGIFYTRIYISKDFFNLHSVFTQCHGKHFQCVFIIIVNNIVLSSCVHASITPFDLVRTFRSRAPRVHFSQWNALRSNCPFSGFYFVQYTCVALLWFIFLCPTCARAVNATCRSRLPSLLFAVLLVSIYNPFWPESIFFCI